MNELVAPFAFMLDFGSGVLTPYTTHTRRRASNMRGVFADSAALERLIAAEDPLIYEVFQYDVPEEPGQLVCCTTVLYPGTVGDEYFMTKGHYHTVRDTAEVYLGLGGRGHLLLMNEEGANEVTPMGPGTVAYVPPGWAHRTVNVSPDPFIFFAVYPGQAGHDYETIEKTGFRQQILRGTEGPVVTPKFLKHVTPLTES